jgi:hypothetical protein
MANQCSSGGLLKCSFGIAPVPLNVLPINLVFAGSPAANIMDNKPFVNIPPFDMCSSPANPLVIANFGAPAPCIPNIVAPWFIGASTAFIGNMPILNDKSKCMCLYGGVIGINFAGQVFSSAG